MRLLVKSDYIIIFVVIVAQVSFRHIDEFVSLIDANFSAVDFNI